MTTENSIDTFKQYTREAIAELRPVTEDEICFGVDRNLISISQADMDANSPLEGDMIARNLTNHNDQWLVNAAYFAANFKLKEN